MYFKMFYGWDELAEDCAENRYAGSPDYLRLLRPGQHLKNTKSFKYIIHIGYIVVE